MTRFIYSLISFLIALFFILLGCICILIPWSSTIRQEVISLITDHSLTISLFGFSFIAIGIAVAVQILLASRRTYYQYKVDNNHVQIDESIIQRYLESYWQELFPNQIIPCHITVKGNKINVTADLPHVPDQQQEDLLIGIQQELGDIFGDFLGYRDEFHLAINFANEPQNKAKAETT